MVILEKAEVWASWPRNFQVMACKLESVLTPDFKSIPQRWDRQKCLFPLCLGASNKKTHFFVHGKFLQHSSAPGAGKAQMVFCIAGKNSLIIGPSYSLCG